MLMNEIDEFIKYLGQIKHTSYNTQVSYRRDLTKLSAFLEKQSISRWEKVTETSLNLYALQLEKDGLKASSISRNIAAIRSFCQYMLRNGKLSADPSQRLKSPKIEKKVPVALSRQEVERLLREPSGDTPKEMRDRAMLMLLYATGIRVSELIQLTMDDLNLSLGYIVCKDRTIPFSEPVKAAIQAYLKDARGYFVKNQESRYLFTNCSGKPMSRQGFWKLMKYYGEKIGLSQVLTPHVLRHSMAVHMLEEGVGMQRLQQILGHSDISTTQMYAYFKQ